MPEISEYDASNNPLIGEGVGLNKTQEDPPVKKKGRTLSEYGYTAKGYVPSTREFNTGSPGTEKTDDSYVVGNDLNEERANRQSGLENIFSGITKGTGLMGTTLASTFTSLPYGILKAGYEGIATDKTTGEAFSSTYDNEISQKLDDFNKNMESWFPNYYSQKEQKATVLEGLGTSNFWGDKVLKNVGFTLGAVVGGAKIAKGLQWGSKILMGANYAREMAAVNTLVTAGMKPLDAMAKVGKSIRAMNAASALGASTIAAAGEGGMEAKQVKDELTEQLISKYKAENATEVVPDEVLAKIEMTAASAGNTTFAANMAILTASDYLQFGKLFSKGFKQEAKRVGKLALTDDVYSAVKPTMKKRVLSGTSSFLTNGLTESAEEGSQTAVQGGSKEYYTRQFDRNGLSTKDDLLYSTLSGLEQTFSSKEGLEGMLLGAITGVGSHAVTSGISRLKGSQPSQFEVDSVAATKINDASKKIQPFMDSVVRAVSLNKDKENVLAGANPSRRLFEDIKHDEFKNLVQPYIETGKLDILKDKLESQLGREDLEDWGSETKDSANEYVSKLLQEAKKLEDAWETVDTRFPNATQEAKIALWDSITNINNRDNRAKELEDKISIDTGVNFTVATGLGKDFLSEVTNAIDNGAVQADIKDAEDLLDIIDDKKLLVERYKKLLDPEEQKKVTDYVRNTAAKTQEAIDNPIVEAPVEDTDPLDEEPETTTEVEEEDDINESSGEEGTEDDDEVQLTAEELAVERYKQLATDAKARVQSVGRPEALAIYKQEYEDETDPIEKEALKRIVAALEKGAKIEADKYTKEVEAEYTRLSSLIDPTSMPIEQITEALNNVINAEDESPATKEAAARVLQELLNPETEEVVSPIINELEEEPADISDDVEVHSNYSEMDKMSDTGFRSTADHDEAIKLGLNSVLRYQNWINNPKTNITASNYRLKVITPSKPLIVPDLGSNKVNMTKSEQAGALGPTFAAGLKGASYKEFADDINKDNKAQKRTRNPKESDAQWEASIDARKETAEQMSKLFGETFTVMQGTLSNGTQAVYITRVNNTNELYNKLLNKKQREFEAKRKAEGKEVNGILAVVVDENDNYILTDHSGEEISRLNDEEIFNLLIDDDTEGLLVTTLASTLETKDSGFNAVSYKNFASSIGISGDAYNEDDIKNTSTVLGKAWKDHKDAVAKARADMSSGKVKYLAITGSSPGIFNDTGASNQLGEVLGVSVNNYEVSYFIGKIEDIDTPGFVEIGTKEGLNKPQKVKVGKPYAIYAGKLYPLTTAQLGEERATEIAARLEKLDQNDVEGTKKELKSIGRIVHLPLSVINSIFTGELVGDALVDYLSTKFRQVDAKYLTATTQEGSKYREKVLTGDDRILSVNHNPHPTIAGNNEDGTPKMPPNFKNAYLTYEPVDVIETVNVETKAEPVAEVNLEDSKDSTELASYKTKSLYTSNSTDIPSDIQQEMNKLLEERDRNIEYYKTAADKSIKSVLNISDYQLKTRTIKVQAIIPELKYKQELTIASKPINGKIDVWKDNETTISITVEDLNNGIREYYTAKLRYEESRSLDIVVSRALSDLNLPVTKNNFFVKEINALTQDNFKEDLSTIKRKGSSKVLYKGEPYVVSVRTGQDIEKRVLEFYNPNKATFTKVFSVEEGEQLVKDFYSKYTSEDSTPIAETKPVDVAAVVEAMSTNIELTPAQKKAELAKLRAKKATREAENDAPILPRRTNLQDSNKKEDINAAQKWFQDRFNGESFKVVDSLINGNAFGEYTAAATRLFAGAEEGTVYHEAFHKVTQEYLTPKQVKSLYDAVRKNVNAKFSDLQAEEWLAEEFRKYVLNGQKAIKNMPYTNNVFRKLYNWIKSLVTGKTTPQQVFEKLASKKGYTGAKKFNNAQFTKLNKNVIEGTTHQQTKNIVESINSHFFRRLFAANLTPDQIFGSKSGVVIPAIYDRVYKSLVNNYEDEYEFYLDDLHSEEEWQAISAHYELMLNMKDGVPTSLNEYAKKAHKQYLKTLGIEFNDSVDEEVDNDKAAKEDDSEDAMGDESTGRDKAEWKNANEESPFNSTPASVKMLLLSLPEIDNEGNQVTNNIGVGSLADINKTASLLYANLQGLVDFGDMYDKLVELSTRFPAFKELTKRLGAPGSNKNLHQMMLENDFRQAFAKFESKGTITLIDETTGKIYQVDANANKLRDRIRENWNANLRGKANTNEGYVTRNDEGVITLKPEFVTDRKRFAGNYKLLFSELGIEFTDLTQEQVQELPDIKEVANAIFKFVSKAITENTPVNNLFDKAVDISGQLNKLLDVEQKLSKETVELSYMSAEGKRIYAVSLNNYHTLVVNKLNNVKTKQQLFEEYPHLDNPYTTNSVWLSSLFDKDGIKIPGKRVYMNTVSGIKIVDNDKSGVGATKMEPSDKIVQEINDLLGRGSTSLIRAADKSSEYAFGVTDYDGNALVIPLDTIPDKGLDTPKIREVFFGYFMDELNSIRAFTNGVGKNFAIYNKQAGNFRLFADILSPETLSELEAYKTTTDELSADLKAQIEQETVDYLAKYAKDVKGYMNERKVCLKTKKGFTGINPEFTGNTVEGLNKAIKAFTVNHLIQMQEQAKLLVGDSAFYKDKFKRVSAGTGTKKFAASSKTLDNWLNSFYKLFPRKDGKVANGRLRTIIYNDVQAQSANIQDYTQALIDSGISEAEAKKILGAYAKWNEEEGKYEASMDEGDAQGWITLDEYREFMMRVGGAYWTEQHEAQYQYETKLEAGEEAGENPHFYFMPIKAQHFGPQVADNIYAPAFHKYSLAPLYMSLVKGRNMESLLTSMRKNQVGYALFASGSKVGTPLDSEGKIPAFYTEGEMSGITESTPIQELYYENLGIQLDIAPKVKDKNIFGSQFRKLLFSNLFGENMNPEFKTLADEYNKLIDNLVNYEFDALTKKLGIKVTKNSEGKYESFTFNGDYTKLVSELKRQLDDKDTADNILDSLQVKEDGSLKYPIDGLVNRPKVEAMLFSIVNNKVLKQKMTGNALVQLASTGFEPKGKREVGGSNYLKSYTRGKDGASTSKMEVEIPMNKTFEPLIKKYGGLDALNAAMSKGEVDEKYLTMVGYRIPTQGLNSMDVMIIKRFLPTESGIALILPTEVVAKSGGDYDIDKLNIFMPNLRFNEYAQDSEYSEFRTKDSANLYNSYRENKKNIPESVVEIVSEIEEDFKATIASKIAELKDATKSNMSAVNALTLKNVKLTESEIDLLDTYYYEHGYRRLEVEQELAQLGTIDRLDPDQLYEERLILDKMDALDKEFEKTTRLVKESAKQYLKDKVFEAGSIAKQVVKTTLSKQKEDEINRVLKELLVDGKLTTGQLNSKTAHQNRIVEIAAQVLTHPDNFIDLITPNTTDTLVDLVNQIRYAQSGSKLPFEEWIKDNKAPKASPTKEFRFDWIMEQFTYFLGGKAGVGIGAVHNTHHILSQIAKVRLNANLPFTHNQLSDSNVVYNSSYLKANLSNAIGQMSELTLDKYLRLAGNNSKLTYDQKKAEGIKKFAWIFKGDGDSIKDILKYNTSEQGKKSNYEAALEANEGRVEETELEIELATNISQFIYDRIDESKIEFDTTQVDLSKQYTKGGQKISDIISQFINAYVDVAKDPFYKDLNAGTEVAGIWFYLLRAGVDVNTIGYFMTQPIIKEYVAAKKINGSLVVSTNGIKKLNRALSKTAAETLMMEIDYLSEALQYATSDYQIKKLTDQITKAQQTLNASNIFDEVTEKYGVKKLREGQRPDMKSEDTNAKLLKWISEGTSKGGYSNEFRQGQSYLLEQFLEIEKHASELTKLMQVTNQDTTKLQNFGSIEQKNRKIAEVDESTIIPKGTRQRILDATIVGSFDKSSSIWSMYKELTLYTSKPEINESLKPLIDDIYNNNKKDFNKEYVKLQNDLVGYITQKFGKTLEGEPLISKMSLFTDSVEDISNSNLDKKDIFTVTPIQSADKKAVVKASIATQYIGFGEGINGSSTEHYRKQVGKLANTGNYTKEDVIFVSIGGNRGNEVVRKAQQDRTIKEALSAIEAGATLITDNEKYVNASTYNTGEQRLAKNLKAKAYVYSETTIDGTTIGIWNKESAGSISSPSLAKRLVDLRKEGVEDIVNNPFIKELVAMLAADKVTVNNVKLWSRRMNAFESNVMTEAFRQILESNEPKISEFGRDLVYATILQSGLNNSPITFTELVPYEYYGDLVSAAIKDVKLDEAEMSKFTEAYYHKQNSRLGFRLQDFGIGEEILDKESATGNGTQIRQPFPGVETIKDSGLTLAQADEFIDLLLPQIQSQAYVENKARTANSMFSFGLRWAKVVPNAGEKSIQGKNLGVERPNRVSIQSKEGRTYGYFSTDQNNNALPDIEQLQPIIDFIESKLGIDMSNYDSVLGNIYDDTSFIHQHRDTTESITAEKYPIIVINLGSDGRLVYDNDTTSSYASYKTAGELPLTNGSVYAFGVKGNNRFTFHHRIHSGLDSKTSTKSITLPNGQVLDDYRITLTFRRAQDITGDIPAEPARNTISNTPTISDEQVEADKLATQEDALVEVKGSESVEDGSVIEESLSDIKKELANVLWDRAIKSGKYTISNEEGENERKITREDIPLLKSGSIYAQDESGDVTWKDILENEFSDITKKGINKYSSYSEAYNLESLIEGIADTTSEDYESSLLQFNNVKEVVPSLAKFNPSGIKNSINNMNNTANKSEESGEQESICKLG